MIQELEYTDDFLKCYAKKKRKIIVYGAGKGLKDNFDRIPEIFYICDKNAKSMKEFKGINIYEPEILREEKDAVYIIVSVQNAVTYREICEGIKNYDLDAIIVPLFNNIAFGYSYWHTTNSYFVEKTEEKLKVNLVCQDDAWIFRKFAERMYDVLVKHNIDTTISADTREDVDINHHIPYVAYRPYSNDTLMITHVDNSKKIVLLKNQLEIARMGICMSKDTMNQLIASGIPREKLCYINPAQDNVIKPHKYVIGITHKCRDDEDLRKRTTAILEVLDDVNPLYFKFFIMGSGWDKIVDSMKAKGFEVDYYPEFEYDKYNLLMQQMDYFLFMGFDEGAMGYLDALAAGAGTIVTPQGYHLDTDCPIDYPCSTVKEFRNAFLDLQKKKEIRVQAVAEWTWDNYAKKHMEIWNYILRREELKEIYKNQLCYSDGIFSTLIEDNRV